MQLTRLTQYRDVCEKNGPLTPGLPPLHECNYSSQPNSAHLGRSLSHTHTLPKTLFDVLPHSLKDFQGNSSWFINNLPLDYFYTWEEVSVILPYLRCLSWNFSQCWISCFERDVFLRLSLWSWCFRGSAKWKSIKHIWVFPLTVRFIFRKGVSLLPQWSFVNLCALKWKGCSIPRREQIAKLCGLRKETDLLL